MDKASPKPHPPACCETARYLVAIHQDIFWAVEFVTIQKCIQIALAHGHAPIVEDLMALQQRSTAEGESHAKTIHRRLQENAKGKPA